MHLLNRGFHFVEHYGATGFWVNPNEGVVPTVCEFDLNEVVATRASWSFRLKNSIRAFAEAIHMFQ